MMRDVAAMQNAGLALGGSLNNAVVVENGAILNEGGLRMEHEFVRHKILDCLGDLYLLGMMVRGKMTASRPGHAMCAKLITTLWNSPASFQIVEEGAGAGSFGRVRASRSGRRRRCLTPASRAPLPAHPHPRLRRICHLFTCTSCRYCWGAVAAAFLIEHAGPDMLHRASRPRRPIDRPPVETPPWPRFC